MNTQHCTFEREVSRAVKSNQWTDELRAHAAGCPECQETITMTTAMTNMATGGAARPLPSYRLIWLKAQYARKEEQLSKLDILALTGMSLGGIVAVLGLLLWRFPKIFGGLMETAVPWRSLVSNGTPLVIIAGALLIVWLLTRDSHFAER